MNKSDYENPESHIFYCDKSDWYEKDENGEQDWSKSQEKVEMFWKLVRKEKMAKKNFDFSEFVFPSFFGENFWKNGEEREFDGSVRILGGVFLDNAMFSNVIFSSFVCFVNVRFLGLANFHSSKFLNRVDFMNCYFSTLSEFGNNHFSSSVTFYNCNFIKTASFSNSDFSGATEFKKNCFNQNVIFSGTIFSESIGFNYSDFFKKIDFEGASFSGRVDFEGASFKEEFLLENIKLPFLKNLNAPSFSLQGAILEESHFYGIKTLENVNFQDSFLLSLNLSNKQILNCDFTGATIGAVQTRGWKPDKATLENTKFIYTDFEIKQTVDEDGEVSKTYHAKPESRVPAEGSFGEGDNVEFTIADFLLDPIKWSYSLNLPKEIRSGFLGYIKFFEDFLRVTENEEVEIRTRREGNKVRVEFLTKGTRKEGIH